MEGTSSNERKKKLFLLWALCTVERTTLTALLNTCGVEATANDGVAESDVLHATTADDDHGVLLQLVCLSRDVRGDFHSIGEAHTCNLTNSGVRLARSHGRDLGTHTALERRVVEVRTILNRIETAKQCDRF